MGGTGVPLGNISRGRASLREVLFAEPEPHGSFVLRELRGGGMVMTIPVYVLVAAAVYSLGTQFHAGNDRFLRVVAALWTSSLLYLAVLFAHEGGLLQRLMESPSR